MALLCAAPAYSQVQPPAASSAPKPEIKRPVYVRRFSLGATLSVLGFSPIPKKEVNIVTTGPAVDSLYTTTPASQRIGYGVTAQIAVTERFAVNASLLMRRAGYQMDSNIIEGTDIPSTSADERRFTTRHEDTRVKFADLPVLIRYYGKDRHEAGPRWFVEGGVVLRRARDVRTSVYSRVGAGETTCCDFNQAPLNKRTARGAMVGAGFQLIDQIGIRVVPEVRYTRWVSESFSRFSTVSRRNQLEGMISLTF
jgi:hypothetical protein